MRHSPAFVTLAIFCAWFASGYDRPTTIAAGAGQPPVGEQQRSPAQDKDMDSPASSATPATPATVMIESKRLPPGGEFHKFFGEYEAGSHQNEHFAVGASMARLQPRAGEGMRPFVLNVPVVVGTDQFIVVDGPNRTLMPRAHASVAADDSLLITATPHVERKPQTRDDGIWQNPEHDRYHPVHRGPGQDPFRSGPSDADWTIAAWTLKAYDLAGATPKSLPYEGRILAKHTISLRKALQTILTETYVTKDEFETTAAWRARQEAAEVGLEDRLLLAWLDHAKLVVTGVPINLGSYNADRGAFDARMPNLNAITEVVESDYGAIIRQSGPRLASQTPGVSVWHATTDSMEELPIYGLSLLVPMVVDDARRVRTESPACSADIEFVLTPEHNFILTKVRVKVEGVDEIVLSSAAH